MPTPNNPAYTAWIEGVAHGKTYKLGSSIMARQT